MMRGDFGLVIGTDPVGIGIRIAEFLDGKGKSKYSHAFIITDDNDLDSCRIIEAEPGGARVGYASEYGQPGIGWIKSDWTLDSQQRDAIVTRATQLLKTPYSFLDYLSLAAVHFHVRPAFMLDYVKSTHHVICSQLVDAAYTTAGLLMFSDNRFPGDVTPADLEDVLNGPKAA